MHTSIVMMRENLHQWGDIKAVRPVILLHKVYNWALKE